MTGIVDLVLTRLGRPGDDVRIAVRSGGSQWTARELADWSAGIASWLRGQGVGPGDYVPVIAARGGALVASWLGVLRSGAAYAPLSLDTPGHRLRHIVTELGAKVALADDAGRALLDGLPVSAPTLDDLRRPAAGPTTAEPITAASTAAASTAAGPAVGEPAGAGVSGAGRDNHSGGHGAEPAVVIYTSGTTGRPKGVLVPHRGLLNTALWWAGDVGLRPTDRVLCTWSTAFDGATFEVFRTLASGAVLVFADDVERRDPRALVRLLRGPDGATVTSMTPSLARAVLDSDEGGPTTLRAVYLGGEAVTRQLAQDCVAAWGAEVRNIYGPTEASCISTYAPVDLAEERPPIGVPLPNTRAYVLGRHGEELPREVPGELYVAGAGVALGYLGQPDLTATAFRPDPYSDDPDARMYATGDRAVLRADGLIDCLGRIDDQVKILGHRVEPDEVRRLIEEQPAVRAAAVIAEGEPCHLVAFVELADPDAATTRDDVLRPLQRWLPPAVLPSEVYVVPAIPMTVNDKADLAAVSGMRAQRLPERPTEGVELTGDELRAAQLFASTLAAAGHGDRNAGKLAPDNDFFMLGGHSLLAVTMLAAGEREFGRQLPLGRFLADPTVSGLGRLLGAEAVAAPSPVPVEAGEYAGSPVQRRFWLIDQVRQLRSAYLVPAVLEFTGVDLDALADATTEVLTRHPGLRARFRLDAKRRNVFYRTDGAPPPVLRTSAGDWSAEELRSHLESACWTPFELGRAAPARAELIDLGGPAPHRVLLVLTVHHIVVDGWGQAVLLEQIAAAYRARVAGVPVELPPAPHPALARSAGTEPAAEAVLARLRGAPTDVELPHDRPRGGVQGTLAGTASVTVDSDLTTELRAVLHRCGVTTFMATAALLATVLARTGTQRDFLFAYPWLGREGADAHTVGMFVNTLVLRVDLRGQPSWRELLGRVRDSATAGYRDADVPFDVVAAAVHPDRDLSRPAVTPVYLAALDAPATLPDFGPAVTVHSRDLDPLYLKYELEVVATDLPDALRLTASYATDLFDAPTVDRLLAGLTAAAVDLVTDLDADVMKENP